MATLQKDNAGVTIKELLESGAHFGHQTHRWNPKMKRFIYEARNGIYIIDLAKTLQQIRAAVEFVRDIIAKRKSILFVGTKKQAKAVVKECAEECEEFYICERWLGGTLTNLSTIRQSVKTLEKIEKNSFAYFEWIYRYFSSSLESVYKIGRGDPKQLALRKKNGHP